MDTENWTQRTGHREQQKTFSLNTNAAITYCRDRKGDYFPLLEISHYRAT